MMQIMKPVLRVFLYEKLQESPFQAEILCACPLIRPVP